MAELSRDEVAEILGRVSDAVAAEIIATGIDKAGLAAARDRVISDRKTHGHVPVEPGGRLPGSTSWSGRTGSWARAAGPSNRRQNGLAPQTRIP